MTDGIEHAPYLLILALSQDHLVPAIAAFFGPLEQLYLGRRRPRFAQVDSPPQSLDLLHRRRALHFYVIYLGDDSCRRQAQGELAVVGQYDQPFGIEVEPPDR